MNVQSIVSSDHRDNWRAFADTLFNLEDADPGYMLLNRAVLPHAQKLRYVLAWCTFYNPGVAAVASQYQGAQFYEYLRSMYPTAKRASERRHFRGQAGLKALAQWQDLYPKPEKMIEACYDPFYTGVRRNMQHMAQMGDYFFWKLADIWDTVFGEPVDFTDCEKYMPKVPKQGAELVHNQEWPDRVWHEWPSVSLIRTMAYITKHIGHMEHPTNARRLKLQEAETVCCVFKQHMHGDYKFGFRSAKAWARLEQVAPLARKPVRALQDGLLAGGIWTPKSLNELKGYL